MNYKYIYNTINNSDLSLMSEECFKIEHNKTGGNSVYIIELLKKYGNNYLKMNVSGNIPIQYFNKKTKQYMDLIKKKHKEDKTWWMSKYLGVDYVYTILKEKKQNQVVKWLFEYGSSATKNSSIFIKYSA